MIRNYLLILFVVMALINCSKKDKLSKEQLLKQSIEQLEARFEKRSLSEISEYVSENYHDAQGRKLRDIKRAIQMQLMRHKSLHVFSTIKSLNWQDEEHVQVVISAAMAGKPTEPASTLTALLADMVKFDVNFVLEYEVYKVQSASWSWASATDFL